MFPKIQRGYPEMGSDPMVHKSRPKRPDMTPLMTELPEMETMTDNPKMARAKYSAGLNFSANLEICGDRKVIMPQPMTPPIKEAQRLMDRARLPCPCCPRG